MLVLKPTCAGTALTGDLDPQSQSQLHTSGQETLLLQVKSNGYEQVAERFMSARNPRTGAAIIREWSRTVPPRSAILDLGCGHGVPISQTLIEEGFTLFGVDASHTLIEAFRERFPNAFVECAGIEDSEFFRRPFDGVVACGLMFLMPEDTQSLVIHKVARALNPNGGFLFTSPKEIVKWRDALADCESLSLGAKRYQEILDAEGLDLIEPVPTWTVCAFLWSFRVRPAIG